MRTIKTTMKYDTFSDPGPRDNSPRVRLCRLSFCDYYYCYYNNFFFRRPADIQIVPSDYDDGEMSVAAASHADHAQKIRRRKHQPRRIVEVGQDVLVDQSQGPACIAADGIRQTHFSVFQMVVHPFVQRQNTKSKRIRVRKQKKDFV